MPYLLKKIYLDSLHLILGDWRYFCYDENKHEKKLKTNYYNNTDECHSPEQKVIFMANGFCNHAGLSDRLKGMTTTYSWCKEHKINFRIFHYHPFSLEEYLIPNIYDWRISPNDICYNLNYVSVNHLMLNHLTNNLVSAGKIFHKEMRWLDSRIVPPKIQHHMYTNMYPESDEAFGTNFGELFKPSTRVEKEITKHLEQIGRDYISISFRFMQLLGDFVDCDGDTLSPKEQIELIDKSIRAVEIIKRRHSDIKTILITTDSRTFLEAVQTLPYVYTINGKIGHINFDNSDDANMKTFIDFFMIANAQKSYLAKSEKMYNSDFARRASMIYHKKFETFSY